MATRPFETAIPANTQSVNNDDNKPGSRVLGSPIGKFNYVLPVCTNISSGELFSGCLVLVLWMILFIFGLFVPTAGWRGELLNGTTPWYYLPRVGAVGLCYTLTNAFFLACSASFLGCMAHRWQVADGSELIPENTRSAFASRLYVSAVLRGFFLYLMFISGFLIVSTEETVTKTEFGQYIRIGGMISVFGFIVGYDPNLLIRLIRRILSLADFPISASDKTSGESTDREHALRLLGAPADASGPTQEPPR